MTEILWYLTRASGVVAMVLIAAAIIDGLIFSGREGGKRIRPAWWLDLHRGLGGYALIFTVFHLLTAYGAGLNYRIIDFFVPGVSKQSTLAITLGVLAFYAIAITVFITWPKRLFRRSIWHALHLLSVPAALAVAVHGWQVGTDALSGWYVTLTVVLCGLVMYPLVLRLSGIRRRRRDDSSGTPVTAVPPSNPPTRSSSTVRPFTSAFPVVPPTRPRIAADRRESDAMESVLS
jgi:DMSO/TMAO reductase YedYZ heme-binding membrane subunit